MKIFLIFLIKQYLTVNICAKYLMVLDTSTVKNGSLLKS